jgi:hypothetical protein
MSQHVLAVNIPNAALLASIPLAGAPARGIIVDAMASFDDSGWKMQYMTV